MISGSGKQQGAATLGDRVALLTAAERTAVEALMDGRAPAEVARSLGQPEPELHAMLGVVREKLRAGSTLSAMAMVLIADRADREAI